MTNQPSEERGIAIRIADTASPSEREAMLYWMIQLLQIRDSKLSSLQKAKQAVLLTKRSEVTWPVVKILATELKRIGWEERSTKGRAGILTAGGALAIFGSQGAGIAALGTAIGVPLWIVLGAGAYFATGFIQELLTRMPKEVQEKVEAANIEIVDVEPRQIKRKGSGSE
jgi:hypothetical protein